MLTDSACRTCGTAQTTPYCAACGEKRISTHDYSITHFSEHVLEVFTHFDFKVFRSVKTLLVSPGTLTRDYLEGRRKPYVGPVQLFVLVNIAFFVMSTLFSVRVFNQSLHNQIETPSSIMGNFFPATKAAAVREELARRGVAQEEFAKEFDAESSAHAKSLVVAIVPLFALAVVLVCGPLKRYLFEHLVFATHTFTAWLTLTLAVLPAVILLYLLANLFGIRPTVISDGPISLALGVIFGLYLYVACRRVYGGGVVVNIARGAVLSYAIVPILQLYRSFLFFTVMFSLH